jgi:hypothetical protein
MEKAADTPNPSEAVKLFEDALGLYGEVFHDFPKLRVIQQDLAKHVSDVQDRVTLPAHLLERVRALLA